MILLKKIVHEIWKVHSFHWVVTYFSAVFATFGIINMREFWLYAKLQVWKYGGIFVDRLNKKVTTNFVHFLFIPGKQQHFNRISFFGQN